MPFRSAALCEPSEAWQYGREAQGLGAKFHGPQAHNTTGLEGMGSRILEAPLCSAL